MSDYPIPSHAAHIWVAGDAIFLGLPPFRGDHGHTVQLPNTTKGLQVALATLRARAISREPTIGTRAAPAQYNVDEILKRVGADREAAQKRRIEEADDLLSEVGL